jgi:Domain of unknown function (DUF4760)
VIRSEDPASRLVGGVFHERGIMHAVLHFRMRRRFWVYLAVGVAVTAVLYPLFQEVFESGGKLWNAAPFLGSILVTIGWIVTTEANIGNSRRQHTITLITQHAFDPTRAANRDIIKQTLPTYRTKLTATMADFTDETLPLLKAIDLELNFYEFLALGMTSGDLDERLIHRSLRGQFVNFYQQMEAYIDFWRAKDRRTWIGLATMYTRWQRV